MTQRGFLYLMALADSYGMKYEFISHAQDKTADDLFHGPHGKFIEYPVGHYTDDTQMSLAHAELLLRKNTADMNARDFVVKWLEVFKRDPHHGYSQYMWKILSESQTPDDFIAALDPARGHTSGGAMRAGIFGLIADKNEVRRITELQARITHNTSTGVNSALAVALSAHYLYHGGSRADLNVFLASELGADWNSAQYGYTDDTNNGLNIVTQALLAVVEATSLSDLLLRVVNNEALSDTDTVAAIAMSIAACARDLADDLPQVLRDGLENGPYGAAYLQTIDRDLLMAFPACNLYAAMPVKHGPAHQRHRQ